jgi:hypothetical protein
MKKRANQPKKSCAISLHHSHHVPGIRIVNRFSKYRLTNRLSPNIQYADQHLAHGGVDLLETDTCFKA